MTQVKVGFGGLIENRRAKETAMPHLSLANEIYLGVAAAAFGLFAVTLFIVSITTASRDR